MQIFLSFSILRSGDFRAEHSSVLFLCKPINVSSDRQWMADRWLVGGVWTPSRHGVVVVVIRHLTLLSPSTQLVVVGYDGVSSLDFSKHLGFLATERTHSGPMRF